MMTLSLIPYADAEQVLTQVARDGWCVVRGVPCDSDNASLSALGKLVGRVSMQGTAKGQPNLEGEGINRVQVLAKPLHDRVGNQVLSTNSDEFSLHTDDSYNPEPARYILMHCWQSDSRGGGMSWMSDVQAVTAQLPDELRARLLSSPYPTPYGKACVLEQRKEGEKISSRWFVRFNRRDMAGYARLHGGELSAQQMSDLAAFEEVAMKLRYEYMMERGDCIVADNHRMLHGRSMFDAGSGRLIKRLRLFAHT
jgi:alpha-ketoglutarate-dependent taurine dioxygenase